jgi:hypothetical protein
MKLLEDLVSLLHCLLNHFWMTSLLGINTPWYVHGARVCRAALRRVVLCYVVLCCVALGMSARVHLCGDVESCRVSRTSLCTHIREFGCCTCMCHVRV